MTNNCYITDNFFNLLLSFVHIVDNFNLEDYDQNFDMLKTRLLNTKKQAYNNNEYYLICHGDTDYYLPKCPYGLSIFNLVRTFEEVDISTGRIIFVTNHQNIIKEFECLIPDDLKPFELPIVIDDCISIFNVFKIKSIPFNTINDSIDVKKIEYHALAMMRASRIHRHALANFIQDKKLTDRIALSYSNNNES